MSVTLQQLREAAHAKCASCEHRLDGSVTATKCAKSDRPVSLSFGKCNDGRWDNTPAPYTPPAKPAAKPEKVYEAIPRGEWPITARIVARLAEPGDKGVGDTIQRRLGKGGEWFKTAFHSLTGHDCGCSSRQSKANALYPY